MDVVKNFAEVEVSTGYDDAATTVVLATGEGARLPDPSSDGEFNLSWWNFTDYPNPADDPNREIVRCSARSTDTLTIVRPASGNDYNDEGSENTAKTHNTSGKTYKMVLSFTKKAYDDIKDYIDSSSSVANVIRETPTGTINGTNDEFTLANTPVSGTEQVYLNGVLQDEGASDDYTISGSTITFSTAPETGDKLLVTYLTSTGTFATGSTSFVYNETPTGTVNGTNDEFTLANTPVSGTEMVYRDGQLMKGGGDDYSISGGTITFTTAPVTGSVILVSYQQSVSVAGNADTLDGLHAVDYGDADGKLQVDRGGWKKINAALTYSSADDPTYVVSTSADLTDVIGVGMKIKFTNNSTTFYGIVTAITSSTITLYGGTDYDVANSAITAPYFSEVKAPIGFPLDPSKWAVSLSNTTNYEQTDAVQATWYNIGSLSLSCPIGSWVVSYKCAVAPESSSDYTFQETTLSTANNSEITEALSCGFGYRGTANFYAVNQVNNHLLTVASKTTYYLNHQNHLAGTPTLRVRGTESGTYIKFVCAYL